MIEKWHDWLNMPKYDQRWHDNDMQDELKEYQVEANILKKWSEVSDLVYTYTRAKWTGHKLDFPLGRFEYFLGVIYMFPKYTSRYLFFRKAGKKVNSQVVVREVRNPKRMQKLEEIAATYRLDKTKFSKTCKRQLRYWPLLP